LKLLKFNPEQKVKMKLYFPLVILICLFFFGCAQNRGGGQQGEPTTTVSKKIYRGKVIDISNRSKTIFLEVVQNDSSRVIELNFDAQTKGIKHTFKRKQELVV